MASLRFDSSRKLQVCVSLGAILSVLGYVACSEIADTVPGAGSPLDAGAGDAFDSAAIVDAGTDVQPTPQDGGIDAALCSFDGGRDGGPTLGVRCGSLGSPVTCGADNVCCRPGAIGVDFCTPPTSCASVLLGCQRGPHCTSGICCISAGAPSDLLSCPVRFAATTTVCAPQACASRGQLAACEIDQDCPVGTRCVPVTGLPATGACLPK
jgi:hypothetical protein